MGDRAAAVPVARAGPEKRRAGDAHCLTPKLPHPVWSIAPLAALYGWLASPPPSLASAPRRIDTWVPLTAAQHTSEIPTGWSYHPASPRAATRPLLAFKPLAFKPAGTMLRTSLQVSSIVFSLLVLSYNDSCSRPPFPNIIESVSSALLVSPFLLLLLLRQQPCSAQSGRAVGVSCPTTSW